MPGRHYDYVRAKTCAEAIEALSDPSRVCRPLAGGTDLLVMAHKDGPTWDRLVDISELPELRGIREEPGAVVVGAASTHAEISRSPLLLRLLPCLAEASRSIGSPQIRNRGTLGGNVVNAAACADTMPALVCLEAVAHIVTPNGERQMAVSEIVAGPGETRLPPASIIREFRIPRPPAGARMTFMKIGRRKAQSIARLSLAVMALVDESGRATLVRLTPGACTAQTRRFDRAEAVLLGRVPTAALVRRAGQEAAAQMLSLAGVRWSSPYKEPVLAALVERGLLRVFGLPEVV